MKLIYQPLQTMWVNQRFGENKACTNGAGNFITCDGNNPPPGYTSIYGKNGHTGIDLATGHGTPVYCAQSGSVYHIDSDAKSGLDVRIESEAGGYKIRHIYEHLLGYQHKVGDYVHTGQVIGWADNTGWSSGDHLHFETLLLIDGTWTHVDPLTIMEPIFAGKILLLNNTLKYAQEQVALLAERIADYLRANKKHYV